MSLEKGKKKKKKKQRITSMREKGREGKGREVKRRSFSLGYLGDLEEMPLTLNYCQNALFF